MAKPVLLDLFCCAGGAAVGYHRAGTARLFVLCCASFLDRVPVLPLSDPKLEPAAAAAAGSSR